MLGSSSVSAFSLQYVGSSAIYHVINYSYDNTLNTVT